MCLCMKSTHTSTAQPATTVLIDSTALWFMQLDCCYKQSQPGTLLPHQWTNTPCPSMSWHARRSCNHEHQWFCRGKITMQVPSDCCACTASNIGTNACMPVLAEKHRSNNTSLAFGCTTLYGVYIQKSAKSHYRRVGSCPLRINTRILVTPYCPLSNLRLPYYTSSSYFGFTTPILLGSLGNNALMYADSQHQNIQNRLFAPVSEEKLNDTAGHQS